MGYRAKVYVAGHTGLVGSALVRRLSVEPIDLITRTSQELDLTNQENTESFFAETTPNYVFLAAAHVGGIVANSNTPADFITKNLQIQTNVISAAYRHGVYKLVFLGSSCIYPRVCEHPIKEDYLLSGPLEQTNEAYAIAKIAGISMCRSFNQQYGTSYLSVMPCNLYGYKDNFNLETSHVLPALIRKFHEAKQEGTATVTLWGSGEPFREFLYVDDLADALVFLVKRGETVDDLINIGSGKEIKIKDLAHLVQSVVGYEGRVLWDVSKPDGTFRKTMDVSKITRLGWSAQTTLALGVEKTYAWFKENSNKND